MASNNFSFDKRAMEKLVNDGMKELGAKIQRELDAVHRTHAGKPVGEVKPALARALKRADVTPEGDELQEWAQTISDGTRIALDVQRARL